MRKDGHFKAQKVVEMHVDGKTAQPFFAAHNMRYLHQMVVNHYGKVVGGDAV